jgi:hypothetical protein
MIGISRRGLVSDNPQYSRIRFTISAENMPIPEPLPTNMMTISLLGIIFLQGDTLNLFGAIHRYSALLGPTVGCHNSPQIAG